MIKIIFQRIEDYILKLPNLTWVISGFLITFFFFFVVPTFLDPSQYMKYFPYNVMISSPIGSDFGAIVSTSSAWVQSSKFVPIVYPAFTLIFYAPFTFLSFETGYRLLILLILVCYVLTTLILPQAINGTKGLSALAMLVFASGLVSYGFQFELQRGQSNILALTFSLIAIYIFHHHPRHRWLAYLLFTVSVQLKLYPAIFIFALIENWSDLKNNIRRLAGLCIVNILALFILGSGPIQSAAVSIVETPATHIGLPFNLSISSFVFHILSSGFPPNGSLILWLQANSWLPQLFLFIFFAVSLLIIFFKAYKQGSKGFNPFVFMACSIGACVIPAISFDYKLAMFPSSIMLLIPALLSFKESGNSFLLILLTFLLSIAYSSTLYPYMDKPEWLQYNLPALFLMLTICTILCCIQPEKRNGTSLISGSNPGIGQASDR